MAKMKAGEFLERIRKEIEKRRPNRARVPRLEKGGGGSKIRHYDTS